MIILIADDININRNLLRELFLREGYNIIEARNGTEALEVLESAAEPVVGLIDWQMPEIDGAEVCRLARQRKDAPPMFLFLLTVRSAKEDIVTGLSAGANDYITKPFHYPELVARVKIGVDMVELQQKLLDRVKELQTALSQVKLLSGLLPICGFCKKVRNDGDYWQQVEEYIAEHSQAKVTHGYCPECFDLYVKPELEKMRSLQAG